RSLTLSGLELEAAALVRLGRPAEAEAAALKMAAAAPYDLISAQRASRYIGLTDQISPAKRAYLDLFVKMWPTALVKRADVNEWAGDFAASAADIQALSDIVREFTKDELPLPPSYDAKIAVAWAMAGDFTKSNALAAQARASVD